MTGRNLQSSESATEHAAGWHLPTMEPRGFGREFTISEVSLVIYSTANVRLLNWSQSQDGKVTLRWAGRSGGVPQDAEVLERIVANQHPQYATWKGRQYGPEDVGKNFHILEVGVLAELFAPTQGFGLIHPRQTMRLLTGGQGYQEGAEEPLGLRLNGIPLQLWGESSDSLDHDQLGPLLMT